MHRVVWMFVTLLLLSTLLRGADANAAPKRFAPPPVDERARHFWSFQPVARPAVPEVKDRAWVRNPIDSFVLARLEVAGLHPAPPADKTTLLRRAFYAVTGLPPSPEKVDAFLADTSPDAYETVVDRLLASPAYGAHWGRHWLDLVRYAETNSFERDGDKPFAWRYRDYVIRSFNADKPYDRFIREQLAGDELSTDADSLIATAFYRLGAWDDEPPDRLRAYYDELDDIVATTGQVFLGLTVNCARCHDHKLDPFPQKDYYRLLAFFHGIRPYDNGPGSLRPIGPEEERRQVLQKQCEKLRKAPPPAGAQALCVTEEGPRAKDTFVLLRGNPQSPGEKVEPGCPSVLTPADAPALAVPPLSKDAHSCGRRRVLADWIADPKNPLTARVMVNRVWQYQFGRGIVRSPSNFGYQGTPPTHPELLDWLASEFVSGGMKLKPLHRLILTSSTFRTSSEADPAALARDPENDLLGRFDLRRLTAEEVRDSILAVSGNLNLSKTSGPGVYPVIPREVLAGQSRPGNGWGQSTPEEAAARSVFVHVKRSLAVPVLAAFDAADADSTCPVRFATTQPTQALALMNGDFVHTQSAVFARNLRKEAGADPAAQVRLALRRVLQRPPTPAEVERGVRFLAAAREEDGLPAEEALRRFCLLALNLDEFVYLD